MSEKCKCNCKMTKAIAALARRIKRLEKKHEAQSIDGSFIPSLLRSTLSTHEGRSDG